MADARSRRVRLALASGAGALTVLAVLAACAPAEPAAAVWQLLRPADVGPETTRLEIGVMRVECSGGETGEVLEPIEVEYRDDSIRIRTDVAPLDLDAADCQGNPVVPITIDLAEPVGDRFLYDVACSSASISRTAFCEDEGVRWSAPDG